MSTRKKRDDAGVRRKPDPTIRQQILTHFMSLSKDDRARFKADLEFAEEVEVIVKSVAVAPPSPAAVQNDFDPALPVSPKSIP